MKKIVSVLLFSLLISFIPVFIKAEGAFYDNYRINKYDVEILVNEDNSFDITETIVAEFNTYKHGIFRKIPYTNTVRRTDGSTSSNSATITNISVSENYTTYREGNYEVIKIGSSSKTYIGEKEYRISYHYALSYDYEKNFDEFYYNIIGNEWDTSISNATFKITMPKNFDISKFGLSSGTSGSTGTKNTEYDIKDTVITGKYLGVLSPKQGITIRIELPEGYFKIPEEVIKEEEQRKKDEAAGLGEYVDDFRINRYNFEMKVNENNTYDIIEIITADFKVPKHGIYKRIPIIDYIYRSDGTSSKTKAKVTNVKVNDNYVFDNDYNNYFIKTGNDYDTYTGEKTYIINYTYELKANDSKDFDEVYYEIINSNWNTSVSYVTFKIEMAKGFDLSNVKIYKGKDESKNIIYSTDGNIITGRYDGILTQYDNLNIRIELPKGSFKYGIKINIYNILLIVFSILFAYFSFKKFKKFGVDDVIVETVEFYPPLGYNSLDIGYYYNNKVENKDVVSLLIYLANKGYIKITDRDENGVLLKRKNFRITKLKEYDGNDRREKEFLKNLFKKRKYYDFWGNVKKNENEDENTVDKYDLEDRFYTTISLISSQTSAANRNKIYSSEINSGKKYIILFMFILTILLGVTFLHNGLQGSALIFIFLFCFVGMLLFIVGFTILFARIFDSNQFKVDSKIIHLVGSLFLLTIGGFIMYGIMSKTIEYADFLEVDASFVFGIVLYVLSCSIMGACYKNMRKRTPFGTKIIGQIRGFKNFLETAEKKELEMLVEENPSYFYDILPYTYVLGISNKWIKKFESMGIKAPDWYDSSSSSFSIDTMSSFMSRTMTSAASALNSSPSEGGSGGSGGSSSGSSSSGGGGSSGGGSGGGGGGSW